MKAACLTACQKSGKGICLVWGHGRNALPTACSFSKCMGQPRAMRWSKSRTTSRICWVVTQRKWSFSWFDLKPTPSEATGLVYVQDADIVMYVSSTSNPGGTNCKIYLHSAMSKNKNESEGSMVAPGIPLGSHRSDREHACMHASCTQHQSTPGQCFPNCLNEFSAELPMLCNRTGPIHSRVCAA
jgi:hypothetical protein